MKILVANKFFFRNGGSEVVMFQERDFLVRSGHEVVDFSMHDERNVNSLYSSYFVGRQDYRGGGRLGKVKAALSLVHSPEAVRRIGALIDETRPDLVHCHNIYHQLTPSIIGAAKARGVPVVLTLHDYKPVCPVYNRLHGGQSCSACLDGDFSQLLRKRCADGSLGKSALLYAEAIVQRWMGSYEKVDRFLSPSRFMLEAVLHRFRPDQVELLYNGADTAKITVTEHDNGYVLYLGRLSAEKGVATLLQAHAMSQLKWPLVVAGSGPLTESLKGRYAGVRFVGHLAGDALTDTIAGASVIVVPSECYENCPMAVLEAMAFGKPVIGSRMGGIPELVVDGETGLLFDSGDASQLRDCLNLVMAEPDRRRQMGRKARQRVEGEFSLQVHNTRLLTIYERLLSGNQAISNS